MPEVPHLVRARLEQRLPRMPLPCPVLELELALEAAVMNAQIILAARDAYVAIASTRRPIELKAVRVGRGTLITLQQIAAASAPPMDALVPEPTLFGAPVVLDDDLDNDAMVLDWELRIR